MSMHRVKYRSKRSGLVVYTYQPRNYYVPAIERCRAALAKRPLKRVPQKVGGGGWRWSAGLRGPKFNDATVTKLIEEGYAICVGDFVERKGIIR